MIRRILLDYCLTIRQGLHNLKGTSDWAIYIYMMLMPLLYGFQYKEKAGKAILFYYAIMLPLIVGMLLSRMYPNQMEKTMLLFWDFHTLVPLYFYRFRALPC
ncbi:MAG: hypothetical protein PWP24_567 [Clostridiales bacterium]|nr:hypothetical protein [Clostridiales bacterium]